MARRRGDIDQAVAVAIDEDKGSQFALKWAVEHLLAKGQSLTLLHVKQGPPSSHSQVSRASINDEPNQKQTDPRAKEIFLPFRCFCTRKDLKCNEVVLENTDISKALVDYVTDNAFDVLVLGSSTRGGLMRRFKTTDVPSNVTKAAPDFCTVYVIGKGKISSVKNATIAAPKRQSAVSIPDDVSVSSDRRSVSSDTRSAHSTPRATPRARTPGHLPEEKDTIKSPFTRGKPSMRYEPSTPESDISFVSSGRPSVDRTQPYLYDSMESGSNRFTSASDFDTRSFGSQMNGISPHSGHKSSDMGSFPYNFSVESGWSSQSTDELEAEMNRLRLEHKQTMEMYSSACKDALVAKQKATELQRWKMQEVQKVEEARLAEKAALALVEKERAKAKAAMEAAEQAQRLAELEAQKRKKAEMKAIKVADGRKLERAGFSANDARYRRYTIEEIEAATDNFSASLKIGEGGYGPVYKCNLDHTEVAVKVLRPDANQGRSQFQQEVDVLSRMRHPNMVLLLGACPEYGCLVYEYMAKGSLDDCLFRRGNTPPLPWQARFRIAAEIATGLHFLHQAKPEPLVHRDLKPGNILLDRNYVSKISDVGLARLVPPSIADSVTQYRMTSTAGTFCYIDPEYQQTGMLGTKSDTYSLGIMLLQIITAKSPMGLTHHVERAIEKGTFADMLDPAVTDWPVEEALCFAKLSLQCAELRRKDRPDLAKVVLPELNRLRVLAEENTPSPLFGGSAPNYRYHSRVSSSTTSQDVMSDRSFPSGYPFRSSGYDTSSRS